MERIVYERQLRRFQLQEQQTFREELEIRASQRPPSQHGTSVRPSTASTQQPQPQPQPQPQQRPSTAPSEVSAASGRSGVPTLKGMAAFGGLQLHQDQGNQWPVATAALAPTGARPIYGVHVEYPPDYDFNIGGTGLHGWGGADDRTKLHGSQGGVGAAARGEGSAKAKESSVQSIQAPTRTPAHASRSDIGPQSAHEVFQPASVLAGRQFQAAFDYTTMLTKDEWVKATARRDTTRAKIGRCAHARPSANRALVLGWLQLKTLVTTGTNAHTMAQRGRSRGPTSTSGHRHTMMRKLHARRLTWRRSGLSFKACARTANTLSRIVCATVQVLPVRLLGTTP